MYCQTYYDVAGRFMTVDAEQCKKGCIISTIIDLDNISYAFDKPIVL